MLIIASGIVIFVVLTILSIFIKYFSIRNLESKEDREILISGIGDLSKYFISILVVVSVFFLFLLQRSSYSVLVDFILSLVLISIISAILSVLNFIFIKKKISKSSPLLLYSIAFFIKLLALGILISMIFLSLYKTS